MKIKVPEYFINFRCIADRCKDSCCVGWEIDVDEVTRAKYNALDTPLGAEIREKTSHGYFPLGKKRRCAFLDDRGLCRIISELGEGYLCDICREHPRYYGVTAEGYEGGIGLGCEEAARMILSLRSMPKFVEIERDIPYSDEDEFASMSDALREDLYNGIFTLPIYELIGKYIAYAKAADDAAFEASTSGKIRPIPKVSYLPSQPGEISELLDYFVDQFVECESLYKEWNMLTLIASIVEVDKLLNHEDSLRPLIFYFTHRYVRDGVEDMSLGARVLFALCSALFIAAISEAANSDDPEVRVAVIYSKNVEYSTDNIDIILDGLSEFL